MNIPERTEANHILQECLGHHPPAIAHAENAAFVAHCIAEKIPEVDPEDAYVLGLLHDIGRKFDLSVRHTIEGYYYMMELGYADVARICITHEYYETFWQESVTNSLHLNEVDKRTMQAVLGNSTFTLYDYIIQMADCLSHPNGICHLETRLVDLILRGKYHQNLPRKKLQQRWLYLFEIKKRIEEKMGESIYANIPQERFWFL